MGLTANRTANALIQESSAAQQRQATEAYLYKKIEPKLSVQANAERLYYKTDILLQRDLPPSTQAIVRGTCESFVANLPQVCGRKVLGSTGYRAVAQVNNAVYEDEVRRIVRQYMFYKVDSRRAIEEDRAALIRKRDGLLANVAVSCAPLVQEVADASIADLVRLRERDAKWRARSRSSGGTGFSGGSGGGGA